MKAQTFLILATLFTGSLYAQTMVKTAPGTTFGLRVGANFFTINGKTINNNDLDNKLLPGFHAGINAEIPAGAGFYVQPGVLYSMKGAKFNDNSKVRLGYIEVPVNLIYKPLLGTGNMVLGFGPYVAFGITGNIEAANGTRTDIDFGSDYNGINPATQFKSFDAGGNLLAGYEFTNKFSLQLNAQLGLVNINKKASGPFDDNTRWRNTGWGVSVGYRF
jgi:Outer membrane protein beta-barrel domain